MWGRVARKIAENPTVRDAVEKAVTKEVHVVVNKFSLLPPAISVSVVTTFGIGMAAKKQAESSDDNPQSNDDIRFPLAP